MLPMISPSDCAGVFPAVASVALSTFHQSSLGNLMVIAPYKLHKLWWTPVSPHHGDPDEKDDPYVFRLDLSELGMSSVRVVFGRDAASGAAAIHAEADLGGLSLIRRPAAERRVRLSPRR